MYSKVIVPSLLLLSVNGASALSYRRETDFAAARRDAVSDFMNSLMQEGQAVPQQAQAAPSQQVQVPSAMQSQNAFPQAQASPSQQGYAGPMQPAQGAYMQQGQSSPQGGLYFSSPSGGMSSSYGQAAPAQGGSSDVESQIEDLLSALNAAYMNPSASSVPGGAPSYPSGYPVGSAPASPLSSSFASPSGSAPVSSAAFPTPTGQSRRRASTIHRPISGLKGYPDPYVRRQAANDVFSGLSTVGDDIANVIENIINGLPSGIEPSASALFAQVTGAVGSGFSQLESDFVGSSSAVGSASAVSTASPTPTSAPSSSAAQRRQVAPTASPSADVFGDLDTVGDDIYAVLNALLGALPSGIQPEASALLGEATSAVGSAFNSVTQAVPTASSVSSASVLSSPAVSSTAGGALAARATHSKNAAPGSHASLSSVTFMGLAAVAGSMFVGALAVL